MAGVAVGAVHTDARCADMIIDNEPLVIKFISTPKVPLEYTERPLEYL